MLTDRETYVLDAIIRDYITEAAPVSSYRVLEIRDLDLSSASIRNSMVSLEDAGYIYQPHTSAGRVPTQKGYRYFVDHLMEEETLPMHIRHKLDTVESLQDVVKMVAKEAHVFAMAALQEKDLFFNFGMQELLGEPEFQDPELVRKFSGLIDALMEHHFPYREAIQEQGFGVFIENENPLPEARCASIMVSGLQDGMGMLLTIGPTRMNYERASRILKSSAYKLNDAYYA
jgi:transcriptional regulator of heat shock response